MKRPSVSQVAAVLELLIRCHPAGMALLAGHEITAEEIRGIVRSLKGGDALGVRIMGGVRVPAAERDLCLSETVLGVVEGIGGWPALWTAVEELRKEMPASWWREAADFVSFIRPGGVIRDGLGGYGGSFFGARGKHGIIIRTARRRFRELLRIVAVKTIASHAFGLSAMPAASGGPR